MEPFLVVPLRYVTYMFVSGFGQPEARIPNKGTRSDADKIRIGCEYAMQGASASCRYESPRC